MSKQKSVKFKYVEINGLFECSYGEFIGSGHHIYGECVKSSETTAYAKTGGSFNVDPELEVSIVVEEILEFSGDYRWLSNFWSTTIPYEGHTYPSTENAYQAMKTIWPEERDKFTSYTASQAKAAGRKLSVREDWHEISIKVMDDINRIKFQDPILRGKLMATGNDEIVEGNTWGDTFWGVCNGVGRNNLGVILMNIRSEIKDSE